MDRRIQLTNMSLSPLPPSQDYLVSALHSVPASLTLPESNLSALKSLLQALDPLRTYELFSYLQRLPLVAVGAYAAAVAIMVVAREVSRRGGGAMDRRLERSDSEINMPHKYINT